MNIAEAIVKSAGYEYTTSQSEDVHIDLPGLRGIWIREHEAQLYLFLYAAHHLDWEVMECFDTADPKFDPKDVQRILKFWIG